MPKKIKSKKGLTSPPKGKRKQKSSPRKSGNIGSVSSANSDKRILSIPGAFVGSIPVSSSSPPGTDLYYHRINPALLADRWLANQFALYERWRPRSLKIQLTSGLSALVNGQLGICWVANDEGVGGNDQLSYFMSQKHKVIGNIRDGLTMNVPVETEFKWLDTDPVKENGYHGMVILFIASPIGGLETTAHVTLTMSGSLEVAIPKVPRADHKAEAITANVTGNDFIYGGHGYAGVLETDIPLNLHVPYLIDPEYLVPEYEASTVACGYVVKTGVFSVPQMPYFPTLARAQAFCNSPSEQSLKTNGLYVASGWRGPTVLTKLTMVEPTSAEHVHLPLPKDSHLPVVALAGENVNAISDLLKAMSVLAQAIDDTTRNTNKVVSEPRAVTGAFEGVAGGLPCEGTWEGEVS